MPKFTSRFHKALALVAAALIAAPAAWAQVGSDRYASVVIDAGSGTILSAASADEARYPASLTKMMTLYMLFDALRDRRVSLDQMVPVSPWAASMSPTKLGLTPGSAITVEQAILGLVTRSANDAAAALGEMLGGDEDRFAQMMTLRARALGMTRTTFRNASGLPDLDQVTTARDMAILARHLVQDHPSYYRYFSVPAFVFRGRTILNHQHMLETYPGADGLKTGYIRDSGYNLVTSAVHGDTRLIGVVLGAANSMERDQHMAMLLDAGFDRTGAPMVLARREPPPMFRLPSVISTAQAAPAYQAPLYSAPYSDAPSPRYQAVAIPFQPAPPLPRGAAVQLAGVRGGPTRPAEMMLREPPRSAAREPSIRRTAERWGPPDRFDPRERANIRERWDPRERTDVRADRPHSRTVLQPAPSRLQPARGYEPMPRVVRPTRTAWQAGHYPG